MQRTPTLIVLLIVVVLLAGCGQGTPSGAAPTAAPPPTAAPTAVPQPMAVPTQPATTVGDDLSEAEMRTIFETSFAAYPWRWRQTVLNKEDQRTITGLIEAQSGERVHTVNSLGDVGPDGVVESILISPTLYMKATGIPADELARVGATEGQWLQVPANSPLAGFAEYVYLVANPPKLLERIGFAGLLKLADPNAKPYQLVGTETIGGVRTNIYEVRVGSGQALVTYHISVGVSDRRIYKMVSDSAKLTATTVVEYDPGITVEPPAT